MCGLNFSSSPGQLQPTPWCPPKLELVINPRQRLVVLSDLYLTECRNGTPVQPFESLGRHIALALSDWQGDGHLVIAGNLFDLTAGRDLNPDSPDGDFELTVAQILSSNVEVADLLKGFKEIHAGEIVVIPGARDSRLAWDATLAKELHEITGCSFALEVEAAISTASGMERVLIRSGREFDDRSSPKDPYSLGDTPWLAHQLQELVPRLSPKPSSTLWGMSRLEDPEELSKLAASQIVFKKVIRYGSFGLIPLAAALLLRIPLALSLPGVSRLRHLRILGQIKFELIGATTLIDIFILLAVVLFVTRRVYSSLAQSDLAPTQGRDKNLRARLETERLGTVGYIGLVCGHSLQPEITAVGDGFYANTGAVLTSLRRTKARLGLPDYFCQVAKVTWLEVDAGPTIHARLVGFSPEIRRPLSDRIFPISIPSLPRDAATLGSFPNGADYPDIDQKELIRLIRPRRIAHVATLGLGLIDLVSALTPPLRSRLRTVLEFLPSTVTTFADAITALIGVVLLGLSYGISKGQRRAWMVVTAAISVGVISNIAKGGDFEESIGLALLLLYLLMHRDSFAQKGNYQRIPMRVLRTVLLLGLTFAIGATSILIYDAIGHGLRSISVSGALLASASRMVGAPSVTLPHLLNQFISPGLFTATIAIGVYLVAGLFLPYVSEISGGVLRRDTRSESTKEEIVELHSRGTLDYFALRDDKDHYIAHNSLIAYANYGQTCLISPDPIGPDTGSREALLELVRTLRSEGKSLAVLGADERWLPTYRSIGLHAYYIGDEAIVDVNGLSLEGKKHKGLRQAVNRVRKYGYTVEFHSPSTVTDELKEQVIEVMTRSRRGDVERGFSMTLGRVMQSQDHDLLETICLSPEGKVVGFCQWVPAPGIDGYSLDLMRRDTGEHPNGLIDFMIVETIEYMKQSGKSALSLNFATMRGVLAGERGDGVSQKLERMVLKRLSDSMQIESLWRFNAKFDPRWAPRYLVYDKLEDLPSVLMAVGKAESFWELPVLGRFLNSDGSTQRKSSSDESVEA